MSSDKTCFYCKQNIPASDFKRHLKTCSARSKKGKQQNNFDQPNGGMNGMANNNNNNNNDEWNCPMCSFRNKGSDLTCNMCRQGKKPFF